MIYTRSIIGTHNGWRYAGVLLILVLSALARSYWSYEAVFVEVPEQQQLSTSIKMLGADPYYHLRQSHQILQNFPFIERVDNATHFPRGSNNYATGLFNVLNAVVTMVVFGSQASIEQTAIASIWVAFILGCFSTLLLYCLTVSVLGYREGLVAIICFTLFPATFLDRSVLGFADQHVAEVCLALAITLALVKLVRLGYEAKSAKYIAKLFVPSVPMLLMAYTWRGAVIYLPIIAVSLFTYATLLAWQRQNFQTVKLAVIGFGMMTCFSLAMIDLLFEWLSMSPQGSRWLLIGVSSLTFGAWAYFSILERIVEKHRALVAMGVYIAVMLVVAAILLVSVEGDWVGNVLLAQKEQSVAEHQNVNLAVFIWQLGLAGIVGGFGIIAGIYWICRHKLVIESSIVLMMLFSIMVIWINTGDFGYLVSPFVAFSCAVVIGYIFPKKFSLVAVVSAICAIAWLFNPLNLTRMPWFGAANVAQLKVYSDGWFSAANWLNNNTPKVNWQDGIGDYGVLTAWEFGNLVSAFGQRVATWSSYPSDYVHFWLTAQSESDSLQWLCPKCTADQEVKYVMVDADSFGPLFAAKAQLANMPLSVVEQGKFIYQQQTVTKMGFDSRYDNAMITKLYAKDGAQLSHYRLVYESIEQHYVGELLTVKGNTFDYRQVAVAIESEQQKAQFTNYLTHDINATNAGFLYDDGIYSSVKIFEVVKGANIGGKAAAGTQIKVQLPLVVSNTGRQFIYENTVVAGEDGRYLLTVPYPTEGELGQTLIKPLSAYQLMVRGPKQHKFISAGEFNVTLAQVNR